MLNATEENDSHDSEDSYEGELHANTAHVDSLARDHNISAFGVGKHRSSRRLDDKGHDIGGNEDLGEPTRGHAEDSFLGEEEVNEASNDHVDKCVDP